MLGERVLTPHGELDLVARRGRVLACIEVKSALVVALDFPIDAYFRPGKRFAREHRRRQRLALRDAARALAHRGPVECVLCEVWIEKGSRRARVRVHRDVDEGFEL